MVRTSFMSIVLLVMCYEREREGSERQRDIDTQRERQCETQRERET